MIKSIKSIKNLGVFSTYTRNGQLQDFNDKNILYGWNYSGKTTLSRLFSFLDKDLPMPNEYRDVEFQIELDSGTIITDKNRNTSPVLIKVFNSDFIKNNLHFDTDDEKIAGIKFSVGDVGEIQDKIKDIEIYIEKAQSIIARNKENIDQYNSFDTKFTSLARTICEVLSFGRSFTKANIWQCINNWDSNNQKYDDFILQPSEDDRVRLNATTQNTGTMIDVTNPPKTKFLELLEKVKVILLKEPTPTINDELLSSNQDLYKWAQIGLGIYQNKPHIRKCAFCGGDISDGEAIQRLNAFYTNEAAKVKSDIEQLKQEIEFEKQKFQTFEWSKKSINDLAKSCQTEYQKAKETYFILSNAYTALLNQLVSILDEKYTNHLFEAISVNIEDFDFTASDDINRWIDDTKDIFSNSNGIISNFENTQKEAKEKYKCHLIAQYLHENNFLEIFRKKTIEEKWNKIITQAIETKEKNRGQLQAKLDSIDKGGEELESFIKLFLSRDDISVEITDDNYFQLKRNGEIAKHLSDGEKTAIAISHFFVLLKSLKDEKKLKNYIIFIDDPISSLDANHIAQVSSYINNFFFEKGMDLTNPDKVCNCFSQLFISTHNFEFFSFMQDATNIKRKKKETLNCYLIKKLDVSCSTIEKMPKALTNYKSEYVYLFSEIDTFKNAGYPENQMYIMPNVIRRFLEMYTLMKLPGNTDEIDNRIKILFPAETNELKILHNFSHFTSFNRVTNHSELILRMPDIIDDLYKILQKDSEHFKSLQEGIK